MAIWSFDLDLNVKVKVKGIGPSGGSWDESERMEVTNFDRKFTAEQILCHFPLGMSLPPPRTPLPLVEPPKSRKASSA